MTAPFKIRVLERRLPSDEALVGLSHLLPATIRTSTDDIEVPQLNRAFLERDLSVAQLNQAHDWLWLCGRPMPPRSLHHQRLLLRDICITEDVGLHLVWWRDRIFIKPLPLYLLSPEVWRDHLSEDAQALDVKTQASSLHAAARGFLFSYTALIAYESDFRIAKECGLLPTGITWYDWKGLVTELLESHNYDEINPRYWYGELRLSRLNKVFRIVMGNLFRGYSRVASHSYFSGFLHDQFALLAAILGYVVIVLTALQVGLGVGELQANRAFQNVSYGLTVFALIAPLIGAVVIFMVVLVMYLHNWRATKEYERGRFHGMGVEMARSSRGGKQRMMVPIA